MLTMLSEMAKKPRSEERQVHPTGERFTVDDRFKKRVLAKLESEDMSMRDLAEQISVQPASISNLLSKPGRTQSRIVLRIVKLWSWKHVTDENNVIVIVDNVDAQKRIARALPNLSEEDANTIAALAERFAAKNSNK